MQGSINGDNGQPGEKLLKMGGSRWFWRTGWGGRRDAEIRLLFSHFAFALRGGQRRGEATARSGGYFCTVLCKVPSTFLHCSKTT